MLKHNKAKTKLTLGLPKITVRSIGKAFRASLATVISFQIALYPTLVRAQEIQGAGGVSVITAPNGVPLINILAPNANGLSHNRYNRFDVLTRGAILNNSNLSTSGGTNSSVSQLGGRVGVNPNLTGATATTILNEVTSTRRSVMQGYLEVHGASANVIVANPNGITCDGCGFLNSPRVTLTTGRPQFGANGALTSFNVEGGDIAFGRSGVNVTNVDLFDVVSRTVAIDGQIFANDVRVRAGRNAFNYATGAVTPLPDAAGKPSVAIDSTAFGGISARNIDIIATERGVGVTMRGDMAAHTGQMTLSANGQLTLGNVSANQQVRIRSTGRTQINRITSPGRVTVEARGGIDINTIATQDAASILSGDGDISITAAGVTGALQVSTGNNISLGTLSAVADGALASTGSIFLGDVISGGTLNVNAASGDLIGDNLISYQDMTLNAGSELRITATALAAGNIVASAGDINAATLFAGLNVDASLSQPQLVPVFANATAQLNLTARSGSITAQTIGAPNLASLSAQTDLVVGEVASETIELTATSGDLGVREAYAANRLALTAGRDVVGVALVSQGTADVTAGRNATLDRLNADSTATLTTLGGMLDVNAINAGGAVTVSTVGNALVDSLVADAAVTINATSGSLTVEQLVTSGTVNATADAGVSAQAWVTSGDITVNGGQGSVLISQALITEGAVDLSANGLVDVLQLAALGDITLTSTTNDVAFGNVAGTGNFTATAGRNVLSGQNTTALQAAGLSASLEMQGTVDLLAGRNLEAVLIASRGNASLAASGNITVGQVASEAALSIVAQNNLSATSTLASLGTLNLQAVTGSMDLGGQILSQGDVTLNAGNGIDAAGLIATTQALTANSGNGTFRFTTLRTTGNAALSGNGIVGTSDLSSTQDITVNSSGTVTVAGTIAAGRDIALTADQAISYGRLSALGDASLNSRSNSISLGNITAAGGELSLDYSGGTIDLAAVAGTVFAGEGLTVQAANANLAGGQFALGGLTINATGSVNLTSANIYAGRNAGGSGDITINTANLTHNAATQMQAEGGLSLTTTSAIDSSMALAAAGDVTIETTGAFTNRGVIYSGGSSTFLAGAFSNIQGTVHAGQDLTIAQAQSNTGTLTATGAVLNQDATLYAAGDITVKAQSFLNERTNVTVVNTAPTNVFHNFTLNNASSIQNALANSTQISVAYNWRRLPDGTIIPWLGKYTTVYSLNGPTILTPETVHYIGGSQILPTPSQYFSNPNNHSAVYLTEGNPTLISAGGISFTGGVQSGDFYFSVNNSLIGEKITASDSRYNDVVSSICQSSSQNSAACSPHIIDYGGYAAVGSATDNWALAVRRDRYFAQGGDYRTHNNVVVGGISADYYVFNKPVNGQVASGIRVQTYGQTIAPGGADSTVSAGGNITIDAGTIENRNGAIAASGDIDLTGNSLTNVGTTVTSSTVYTCEHASDCTMSSAASGLNTTIAAGQSNTVVSHSTVGGTIHAGGALTGSFTGQINNTSIAQNTATTISAPTSGPAFNNVVQVNTVAAVNPNVAASGVLNVTSNIDNLTGSGGLFQASGTGSGGAGSGGSGGGQSGGPSVQLSQVNINLGLNTGASLSDAISDAVQQALASGQAFSGLNLGSPTINGQVITQLNQNAPQVRIDGFNRSNPGHRYLIETRFKFIDQDTFYGSQYFMDQIGHDPDHDILFLGDPYFETELVRQTILQQTGKTLLDPAYGDPRLQMKALIDNGVALQQSLNLTPGTALSTAQTAALTQDVVIYEERTVRGQQVYVPQIYLANADTRNLNAGGVIAGTDVALTAASITNQNIIQGTGSVALSATDGAVTNISAVEQAAGPQSGGSVFAGGAQILGGDITIDAETFTNAGSLIADNALTLDADSILSTRGDIIADQGTLTLSALNSINLLNTNLSGNAVDILAGQDFIGAGVDIASAGDTTIFASGNAFITSLENQTSLGLGYGTVEEVTNTTSSLTTGGDLSISTLGAMTLSGVDGNIGGSAIFSALSDLTFDTVADTRKAQFGDEKNGRDSFSLNSFVTSLTVGGDLSASSAMGDLTMVGTQVQAGGAVDLSGSQVVLAAAQDIETSSSRSSKKSFFSSSSHSSKTTSITNQGVALGAVGDITITATESDLITAGTDFSSTTGDITLSAAQDVLAGTYTDVFTREEKKQKSSFFGLISLNSQTSEQNAYATGTSALADVDLSLVSGGDTGLVGAQLGAGGDLNISVGGNLSVEAAVSSERYDHFSSDIGAVLSTIIQENKFKETAALTKLKAGGDVSISVDGTTQLTLYTTEGQAGPGLSTLYPDELLELDGLELLTRDLADEYFYDEQVSLSPAFKALISVVVSNLVVPGLGSAVASGLGVGSSTAAWLVPAVNSFASTLIVETLDQAVGGDFDIGAVLKAATFSGVSAGLTGAINLETFIGPLAEGSPLTQSLLGAVDFSGGLTVANLLNGAIDSVITSGLSSIVHGTDFGETLSSSLLNMAINLALADVQNGIGDITQSLGLGEGSPAHMLMHALAGCAAAAAQQGSCAAGAAGGIAQSLFAGSLEGTTLSDAEQQRMTAVIGALAGFAFSGGNAQNVNLASSIAVSGIANNRQLHRNEVEWLRNNARAFAREQCALGNCITDEEALRLLTLQAGRQVDALLATGTAENAAARAFLEANKPTGQIYASTSNDYVDARQTWFSATPDQFANQYINLPTIRQASDLYQYFPTVQSTRQGSLDLFINNLAGTQQDDVYDLSPTARMDAAREIVLSVSNVMDTFPGEAAVHLNANIFAATAVRKLLSETMSNDDIALLSRQEQRERQQLVQMSWATTVGSLPAGQASGTGRTSIFKKWGETAKRILGRNPATNNVPTRPLTADDLGITGQLDELTGTFSVQNGVANVRIDMVEGNISNPLSVVNNIIDTARANGATSLRLEGTLANDRLLQIMQRRYGATTSGANDVIEIDF